MRVLSLHWHSIHSSPRFQGKCISIVVLALDLLVDRPHVRLPDRFYSPREPTVVDPRQSSAKQNRAVLKHLTYMSLNILDPHDSIIEFIQIVKCCLRGDRINQNESMSVLHIQISHGWELFLRREITDSFLQFSHLPFQPYPEFPKNIVFHRFPPAKHAFLPCPKSWSNNSTFL